MLHCIEAARAYCEQRRRFLSAWGKQSGTCTDSPHARMAGDGSGLRWFRLSQYIALWTTAWRWFGQALRGEGGAEGASVPRSVDIDASTYHVPAAQSCSMLHVRDTPAWEKAYVLEMVSSPLPVLPRARAAEIARYSLRP